MSSEQLLNCELKSKPMEVLLVEDGLIDARVTIYAVRRSQVHHRITLVRSIAEANQFLNQTGIFARAPRPDLLLLDMMLPDGTGIDVMKTVAGLEANADSKLPTIVVLTASEDESLRKQCSDFQVADFLKKPVREADFMRLVRDHKKLMIYSTPLLSPA